MAVKGGLIRRMITASALLAVILGVVFGLLVYAINDERETARLSRHSQEVLATANELERLVIDIESSERGYLLSHDERFLNPWEDARTDFPEVSARLRHLTRAVEQQQRADRLIRDIGSYIVDYSVPVVDEARGGLPSARSVARLNEGRQRVDSLRTQFTRFARAETDLGVAREAESQRTARWAIGGGVAGAFGSMVLIALFTGYLTRSIVRPVRRASEMAVRLAGGDLATRVPMTSTGEIGALERSFNTMGQSLERGRDELSRLAADQAALRRVATLVAHGASRAAVFSAVAEEVGRLLQVDGTRLLQYGADGSVTVMAAWGRPGTNIPIGDRTVLDGEGVAASVLAHGAPYRVDSFDAVPGEVAAGLRAAGLRAAVGAPIIVQGRTWGVMTALSTSDKVLAAGVETRFAEFTDLVATAIANGQAHADLIASRARVVAATDQTRRRIERDLHDGLQQRLVSLALDLRSTEANVPPELSGVRAELSEVVDGLSGALDELREISRGIHPAVLSEAGLKPALKALARRSALPVELDVRLTSPLPQPVEVAAYYVVAEALANAIKYAEASFVAVVVEVRGGSVSLTIRDDGVGGADPTSGSGLVGLTDRVEALGGTLTVHSPPGTGTELVAELPLQPE